MSVYLITGASSGIGREMVRVAVKNGHTVFGVARREERLNELAEELGERFVPKPCDVSDPEAVRAVCAGLDPLPDVVILNAGMGDFDSKREFDITLHRRTYAVNYFGALEFVDALFGPFAERGHGTFVAISSLAAYRGIAKGAAYGSSKAALSHAFESMRLTYRKLGLRFVTVHPGFMDTPMTEKNKTPMPFIWKADKAARHIMAKVEAGKINIAFPLPLRLVVAMLRFVPARLYQKLVGI